MRRVFGLILIWPLLCSGQYVDTIQGRITVKYNNPDRIKLSVLAGGTFETQSVGGSVVIPAAFADVHYKPLKHVMLHGAITQQFQLGWQYQKIKDTRNIELGGRVFFKKKTIDKTKTFTAGNILWNYDFLFPVKILWNMGLSGSYKAGTAVFNSGLDPNTAVRFRNMETQKITFLERAAIPYTFSEISAGFVVSTAASMRVDAHLPNGGASRARRMKTLTELRVEGVLGYSSFDESISRKGQSQATKYIDYDVLIDQKTNWGFKVQGIFKRKLMGFKIESGVRPGIHYRFSDSERNSILDRSYLIFGMGFGWM